MGGCSSWRRVASRRAKGDVSGTCEKKTSIFGSRRNKKRTSETPRSRYPDCRRAVEEGGQILYGSLPERKKGNPACAVSVHSVGIPDQK